MNENELNSFQDISVDIKFTKDGKTPADLNKNNKHVFFVQPETEYGDQGDCPPMPLLVAWIYGNVNNWKVCCTFEKHIGIEIGDRYRLVAYIELPDQEKIHVNQKIIKLLNLKNYTHN